MIDIRKIMPGEKMPIDACVSVGILGSFGVEATDVAVSGHLTNNGKSFELEGWGKCCVLAVCSRCLCPVKTDVEFHIVEDYVEEETGLAGEDDISFSNKMIDLLPAAERNLLVNLPMKLLCDPNCIGLCSKCGVNLNEGKCECDREINEQFRELLQLFNNKEV